MIWFYFGKDGTKVRSEAKKASVEIAKKKGIEAIKIGDSNFDRNLILGLATGEGFFISSSVVRLENIGDLSEGKEFYSEFADILKNSQTIFIVAEVSPLKDLKDLLSKVSAKKIEIKSEEKANWDDTGVSRDSVFSFSSAFGDRDKKKLWVLFNEFLEKGMSSEELVHNLFWQAKMIKLAYKCKNANEAGLKPFVFSKAKSYSKNYTENDIDSILEKIVVLYQEGHKGEEMNKLLEEFILGL